MEFIREKEGEHGESLGQATLYVNEEVVAQSDMRTQTGKFTLSGDGLCIGRDSGVVAVSVETKQYLDLEKLAAAALAVD